MIFGKDRFTSAAESDRPELLACLEVQNLIREIGLIDEGNLEDEAFHEIELEIARATAEANNTKDGERGSPCLLMLPSFGLPPLAPIGCPRVGISDISSCQPIAWNQDGRH
jgi:hypothetical protein